MLQAGVLDGHCQHAGRRGTQLVLEYADTIVADIQESCTETFIAMRGTHSADYFHAMVANSESICACVSSEIGAKLDAMWKRLPGMVLGFFGEENGYTPAIVNSCISKAFVMYDSIEDKSKAHRVAKLYLDKSSCHRKALELKIRSSLTLRDFKSTWVSLRGHSTALLVSRRQEGDHRTIHLNSKATSTISAPLVMARLRSEQLSQRWRCSPCVLVGHATVSPEDNLKASPWASRRPPPCRPTRKPSPIRCHAIRGVPFSQASICSGDRTWWCTFPR